MKIAGTCLALAAMASSAFAWSSEIGSDKKVIAWGRGDTDTRYMREHTDAMEASPFDGVIFEVFAGAAPNRVSFSSEFWGARRFTEEELAPAIEDLKATRFARLTDNFLRIHVTPGNVDWFDPEFDAILENARLAAKVAAEGNVRAIALDPEMYGQPVFVYGGQKYRETRTFEDYCAQVRLRGRQFMEAIQSQWESPLILLTYAWSQVGMDPAPSTSVKGFGLLPSFLDGWLDAAGPKTFIVDGFEQSYTYRDDRQFAQGRDHFQKAGESVSSLPGAYREHVCLGFGLWMDQGSGSFEWRLDDPNKNKISPLEFEYAVHRALTHADRYVWVYCGQANWWTGENLPPGYAEAIRNARKSHDPAWTTERAIPGGRDVIFLAAGSGAADDNATFGELWDRYEPILDLPRDGWLFRTDPNRRGEAKDWFATDTDTSDWTPIEIGKFWTEQGYVDYHGVAWYRRMVDIPSEASGKPLLLSFGAVDETATVYVNGHKVGQYGLLGFTWTDRFEIDISAIAKPGQENLIVVRVEDTTGVAGIWKPIKLIAPKR